MISKRADFEIEPAKGFHLSKKRWNPYYNVNGKGKQTATINGNSLEPGIYLYALVIDGQEVDTKRMILTE